MLDAQKNLHPAQKTDVGHPFDKNVGSGRSYISIPNVSQMSDKKKNEQT